MPLPDLLPIQPFTRPVHGDVVLPGSKSLTNRALLLAALCDAPITLTGALFSEDTQLMSEALRKLGCTVEADEAALMLHVSNQQHLFRSESPVDIFVGLAGTAARFLTALCAAAPRGIYRIDGVPQMRKRPMKPLIDALRALGADIRCTGIEGFFPLEIHARGLGGGRVELDASESSQLLSALLMVGPKAKSSIEIQLEGRIRWPFVQMTALLMQHFGQPHFGLVQQPLIKVPCGTPYQLKRSSYAVEPDATAASYFAALAVISRGDLVLGNLHWGLQGDTDFLSVLGKVGAVVEQTSSGFGVSFSSQATGQGVTQDFSEFSDTFLTLAALAPLLSGPTRITGIAHTRKQETDRVAGMARELIKLGQHVVEAEDSLTITPQPLRSGVEIETYHDHRFAMSFGILGCHDLHGAGRPWLSIQNPACCAKTFPDFFELLETLRQNSFAL